MTTDLAITLNELVARGASPEEFARHLLLLNIEQARAADPELGEMLRACAIPRRFDEKIIGVLRAAPDDGDTNARLLAGLLPFSFVLARTDRGYVYHDNTRDLLLAEWNAEDKREQFVRYNERLSDYYKSKHDEENQLERDWERVAEAVRRADAARHMRIASLVDARILPPMVEALYHRSLVSPQAGYDLCSDYCFAYEGVNRAAVCESLLNAMRGIIERSPHSPHSPHSEERDRVLNWLSYWDARVARQLRRFEDAERIANDLLTREGLGVADVKLRLWTLDTLVNTLRDRDKLLESRERNEELVALALQSRQDTYNLPLWLERAANLHWTLDELPQAARQYRRAIDAARDAGNVTQQAYSMLDLCGVLEDLGQWEESFEMALAARGFLLRHQLNTDRWLPLSLSIRLSFLAARRDPRLLDTLYTQVIALAEKVEDESQLLGRRVEYANLLRLGGQAARAEVRLTAIEGQVGLFTPEATPEAQRLDLLLRRALTWEDHGLQEKAIAVYGEMIAQSEGRPGVEWYHGAALHNRGACHGNCGKIEEARADLRAAHAVWRRTGRKVLAAYVRVSAAELSRRSGQLDRARTFLDQSRPRLAASSLSYLASHHRIQAMVHRDRGEWAKAGEEFAKAAELHASLEDYAGAAKDWNSRAEAAAETGDFEFAAGCAAKAQLHWQQLAANNRYAPSEAAKEADEANARGACDLHDWREVEDRRERLLSAREHFRHAIGLVAGNPFYHLNLADACAELEEWDEAARAVETAIECAPDWMPSPILHEIAAAHHLKQGDALLKHEELREAEAVFSQAQAHLEGAPAKSDHETDSITASLHVRFGFLAATRDDAAGVESHFKQYLALKGGAAGAATSFVEDCGALISNSDQYPKLKSALDALRELQTDPAVGRALLDAQFELVRSHHDPIGQAANEYALIVTPVAIEGDARIFPGDGDWWESHILFKRYIPEMRDRIQSEMGLSVPGVRVRANESDLAPYAYLLILNEVPIVMHTLQADRKFCPDGPALEGIIESEVLGSLDWGFNPLTRSNDGYWAPQELWAKIESAGLRLWDHFEFLIRHLESLVRSNLALFFGLDELAQLLDRWQADAAEEDASRRRELIRRALPDSAARVRLVQVMQGQLKESVPVREIETILDAFSQPGMEARDVVEVVEALRMKLRGNLLGADLPRRLLRLSDAFEAEMKRWVQHSEAKVFFAIPPEETQQLLAAVRVAIAGDQYGRITLVVADETIRPFVRRLIELEFPGVPVLAWRELRRDLHEKIAGEVEYEP